MTPIDIGGRTKPIWTPDATLLLHPNIPQPLHGLNPRTILGKEWWDLTRKTAEALNNYCCYACGIHRSDTKEGWLEGHEVYAFDELLRIAEYLRTVSLCNYCHSFIHSGRLLSLATTAVLPHIEYARIVTRGVTLLRDAGLNPIPWQIIHMQKATKILKGKAKEEVTELCNSLSLRDSIKEWLTIHPTAPEPYAYHKEWCLIIEGKEYFRRDAQRPDVEESSY